jgi:hypothetical protein
MRRKRHTSEEIAAGGRPGFGQTDAPGRRQKKVLSPPARGQVVKYLSAGAN